MGAGGRDYGNCSTAFALMIGSTAFALMIALIIRAIAVLDVCYVNCSARRDGQEALADLSDAVLE